MSEQKRDRLKDEKILSDYSASGNLALMQAAIIGAHWINRAVSAEDELRTANHLIARLTDEKTVAIIRAEKAEAALAAKGENNAKA